MTLTQSQLDNLQVGDILWEAKMEGMGNTTMKSQSIRPVKLVEAVYFGPDAVEWLRGKLLGFRVSWNGNGVKPHPWSMDQLRKLNAYHPKPKRDPFQDDKSYESECTSAAKQNAEDKAKWKPRLDAEKKKNHEIYVAMMAKLKAKQTATEIP